MCINALFYGYAAQDLESLHGRELAALDALDVVMSTEDVTWGLTAMTEGVRMPGTAKRDVKSITVHARANLLREMMTEAIRTRSVVSRVRATRSPRVSPCVRSKHSLRFFRRGAERSLRLGKARRSLSVVTSSSAMALEGRRNARLNCSESTMDLTWRCSLHAQHAPHRRSLLTPRGGGMFSATTGNLDCGAHSALGRKWQGVGRHRAHQQDAGE